MSISRPGAVIILDGQRLSASEAAIQCIRAVLSVRGTHDSVEVMAWHNSKLKGAAPGDSLSIQLGEVGDEVDVFTGEVTLVQASHDGLSLESLASTLTLSRTYVTQLYLSQSVADIVNNLASGAQIGNVKSSVQLESYAVDRRQPVWAYLIELAHLSGAEVGADAGGGLRFVPVSDAAPEWEFRYGAELLGWSLGIGRAAPTPSIAAYGASSEAGAEKWHWIRHDPVPASIQDRSKIVPAIRSKDVADGLNKALTRRALRASTAGVVRPLGAPRVRPGEHIRLKGLPSGDPGPLRVLEVEHVLDNTQGFVTTLSVEGADAPGGVG